METLAKLLEPFLRPFDGQKSYLMSLICTALGLWLINKGQTDLGALALGLAGSTAALRHTLQKLLDGLPKGGA